MPLAPVSIAATPTAMPSWHGLVESSEIVEENNDRWIAGFEIDPETCVVVSAYDPACANDDPLSPGLELEDDNCVTTFPVMYELAATRSSFGFEAQDFAERPRLQLEAGFGRALEAEFWTGAVNSSNQHLTVSTATLVNGGAALDPKRALAALEGELASYGSGGRGMIHATAELVSMWAYDGGLLREDEETNRLVTISRGTIVVVGSGYPGTGPAGATNATPAANHTWAFASGLVHLRMSEIEVSPETLGEALDRNNNTVTYRAMRYAATVFNPCSGPSAVYVNLED